MHVAGLISIGDFDALEELVDRQVMFKFVGVLFIFMFSN